MRKYFGSISTPSIFSVFHLCFIKQSFVCNFLIAFFLLNMHGCCFDVYGQHIDRSGLGDDIVSRMLKDKSFNAEMRRSKWEPLTNDFFSTYRDENEVVEYFKKIGGECWGLQGEFSGACRVTRESPWYAWKSSCDEDKPKLQGLVKDVLIYKFKKIDGKFHVEYEWDYANIPPAQKIIW